MLQEKKHEKADLFLYFLFFFAIMIRTRLVKAVLRRIPIYYNIFLRKEKEMFEFISKFFVTKGIFLFLIILDVSHYLP